MAGIGSRDWGVETNIDFSDSETEEESGDWSCSDLALSDLFMAGRQTSAINICIHRIIPNILKRRTCRHVHGNKDSE